jgi:hypothetical protein
MSEPFNQLSLTRCSDAYWRVTFNHPPINLLDDIVMTRQRQSNTVSKRHNH